MRILLPDNKKLKILVAGGICLYIALTVPFLQNMPVTMDEVQFAEPAYNFITYGHFGTTSLSGLFNFQQKTFWQHPLYLALMYFPIKVFGYSFWSIKILSVVIGLIALIFAYKIGKVTGVPNLFPAMLTLNVLFIFLAKIGRMEVLTMCLSLAAFYCALQKKYLLAGLTSSLAILTHPIGAFTVLNTLIVFGYHRKIDFRYFLGLVLPFIIAFCLVLDDFGEFRRQYFVVQKYLYKVRGLFGGPGTQAENFLSLIEQAKTWLKWQLPVFTLFVWGFFREKDSLQKTVVIILLTNFLGLAFMVPNKYVNYYTALVLPYTVLFVAIAVAKHHKVPVILLLIVSLAVNGLVAAKAAASYKNNESDVLSLQMLLEPGSTVLGPVAISVPLQNRKVIGFHNVRMIMDLERKTAEEVLTDLKPDYIVVDSAIAGLKGWPLFTSSQDEFLEFLKRKTVYCGRVKFNGDTLYIFNTSLATKFTSNRRIKG